MKLLENMTTVNFPGKFESLSKISKFVANAAKKAGLGDKATYAVQLAVDEACSNIIEHSYRGEGIGDIQCTCQVSDHGLTVILRDRGYPFKPEGVPEPKKNAALKNLPPRGAGLYLMRKLMDKVNFEFTADSGNVLTMVKYKDK